MLWAPKKLSSKINNEEKSLNNETGNRFRSFKTTCNKLFISQKNLPGCDTNCSE